MCDLAYQNLKIQRIEVVTMLNSMYSEWDFTGITFTFSSTTQIFTNT